ncbi:hypothetical protein EJA72_06085 [Pseudomonas sp. PB120]|nr:hypothetical protein [Pseudomonas sp. PB120]
MKRAPAVASIAASNQLYNTRKTLWRGSLLPLDCAAVLFLGAASRPSGTVRRSDKLPRHK